METGLRVRLYDKDYKFVLQCFVRNPPPWILYLPESKKPDLSFKEVFNSEKDSPKLREFKYIRSGIYLEVD